MDLLKTLARFFGFDASLFDNKLHMCRTIQPIVKVGSAIRMISGNFEGGASSGTGLIKVVTPPSGKRWRLIAMYVDDGTGTFDMTYVAAVTVMLHNQTAANSMNITPYHLPYVILTENTPLYANISDHTTAGIGVYTIVVEESPDA